MREIKFRGKRIANGDWIYGDLIHNNDQLLINPVFEYPYEFPDDFDANVHPSTVGQYTGLKDKHGKEIYEGDIVRHNYYRFGNGKGIVCYSAPNFALKYLNKNGVCNDFTWDEWELFEIIGNIHDNPELLGESYHEN